jgi:hypothetical protein
LVDRSLLWDLNQSRTFDYVQDSKDTLKAIAQMMGDVLGETMTVISGLAATASTPASLSINLAAGSIYQLAPIDATANGAIAQDTTQVLQQGIIGAQTIVLSAAGITAGRSQWHLIEAQFSQTDVIRPGDPNGGLLFFYDANNVSQPFQGPGGSGTTTPTVRQGVVTVGVITGAAAATGSEVPPQPTPGWTPLYLVDLSYGQTQIQQSQIQAAAPSAGTGVPNTYPYAPFLAGLLDSHHGGVPGQAPKINLQTEVQGTLPASSLPLIPAGNLPFPPVQQGGGAFQGTNKVYIGYDGGGLRATVDVTDFGRFVTSPTQHITFDWDGQSITPLINGVSLGEAALRNWFGYGVWSLGNMIASIPWSGGTYYIMFGTANIPSTTATPVSTNVNLPTAFPTSCDACVVGFTGNTPSQGISCSGYPISNAQLQLSACGTPFNVGLTYIAIGH